MIIVPFQGDREGKQNSAYRSTLTKIHHPRPLQNVQFCSSSRKAKILATGIYWIFRGLKFESDAEIGQKGTLCKGLIQYSIIKTGLDDAPE